VLEGKSTKSIIETICCKGGSEELILQVIEIIRLYYMDNDDKSDWIAQLICEKLLYHPNEEIVCAAVEFCEEFIINHRSHKNYLFKANLLSITNINLRKRIMYLLLNTEKGLEILTAYRPNFIKD